MRGDSGSSCVSSLMPYRNSAASPSSRRRHLALPSSRVRPPTTADSTMSSSHFHGDRSVPATTASSSESGRSVSWLVVGGWWLVVGGWWLVVGGSWFVVGGSSSSILGRKLRVERWELEAG